MYFIKTDEFFLEEDVIANDEQDLFAKLINLKNNLVSEEDTTVYKLEEVDVKLTLEVGPKKTTKKRGRPAKKRGPGRPKGSKNKTK